MTDIRELGRQTGEQVLGVARQGQDAAVEAVKTWADAVQRVTAELPVPPVAIPVPAAPEGLPTAAEMAELYDGAFAFAEKALAGQREFTHRVFEAAAPAAEAVTKAVSKAATQK